MICPFCKHENKHGALVCENCHQLLISLDDSTRNRTAVFNQSAAAFTELAKQVRPVEVLGNNDIELFIDGSMTPVKRNIVDQIMIGRSTPNITTAQFIDLAPYGGYKKGISRAHAVIQRSEKGWLLLDLGSSNGTWLNNSRLMAYLQKLMQSNSRIRLGQLEIEFYCGLSSSEESAMPKKQF